VPDPSTQYVESPAEVLLAKGSDCEGIALITSAMLESIGIDADIGVTHSHAFVRAQLPDSPFWLRRDSDYVWLDPTNALEFGEVSFNKNEVVQFFEVA